MNAQFHTCVICDLIRPELNGKLIILGFLGVCPNVDITLSALDRPIALTFLLNGNIDAGTFNISLEVFSTKGQRIIGSTPASPITAEGNGASFNIAPMLLLTFGQPGEFEVRCLVNGVQQFSSTFRVSSANPTKN